MEQQAQTIQVPRMTEEIQNVTNYVMQTVQEPVQVMVPQVQTVNTIQNINKVVEYQRTPVNTYTVPGPSYQMPATTGYTMPTTGYTMPTTGYQMPATTGYGYGAPYSTVGYPNYYGR
jgi:hypothetical protein